MASMREETSYGEGLGAGGKFRKRPFRKTQTTPYDRPPIAVRNPSNHGGNNGWISKIVDPAQRLLTAGAHRLFSSVFRKRLPPPPSQPTPEVSQEVGDKHQEVVVYDSAVAQEGSMDGVGNPSNSIGGLVELEQILKQKTFTRSEIDQLTALLHSKTVDTPVGDKGKRSEVIPLESVVSHDRKGEFPYTPLQERGTTSHLPSTPGVTTSVLDEDVASPAELAKAYMGSRPSKVSPSMLGFRSQSIREESNVLCNVPLPSKSPVMSVVPRYSGYTGVNENGFITPRSRGRSAIYNMARTPYSKTHPSSTSIKISGHTTDGYGGSSLSQFALEQNGPSGSKHGALKRRSSVLDNDIGSVSPIRRIRQKAISPKNSIIPISGSPFPGLQSGDGSAIQNPPPSIQKAPLLGESKPKFTENGNSSIPGTSSSPVPSKSSEMASKILQQLDKLVPKHKSPTKLSSSMLRGQALRSLENLDSSLFLDNVLDNNMWDSSLGTTLPDVLNTSSQMQDNVEGNTPGNLVAPSGNMPLTESDINTKAFEDAPNVRTASTATMNAIACPPVKKRAFQMSAHEEFLDLDDDVYANGADSTPLTEGREIPNTSATQWNTGVSEAFTVEKVHSQFEAEPPASPTKKEIDDFGIFDGSVVAEKKSSSLTLSPIIMPPQPALEATQSILTSEEAMSTKESNAASPLFSFGDEVASTKEANAASPIFSFGDKVASTKEPNDVSLKFGFSSKNMDSIPQFTFASPSSVTELSGPKSLSSDPKPESSISFSSVTTYATGSAGKVPELDIADGKNNLTSAVFLPQTANSSSVSTTSNGGIFSFGASTNNLSLKNGFLASSASTFSSTVPPIVSSSSTSHNLSNFSTTIATTSSSTFIAAATPPLTTYATVTSSISTPSTSFALASFSSAPVFQFGSSVVPSLEATQVSAASKSIEAKDKQDTGFGSVTSSPFGGGTSSALSSTSSSIFGFGAAPVSSTANNQFQGSNPFAAGTGSLPSAQVSPAGNGIATSVPIQVGSVASSSSFGSLGNTSFSSGSSLFGSGTAFGPSASTTFGLSSSTSTSEVNAISTSTGTTSSLFNSSWQQPAKSPIFASTFNSSASSTGFSFGASSSGATTIISSSTGFSFGASSASTATTNGAPMVFGSSSGASTSSIFSFGAAAAATTPSQPVFGSSSPAFSFGSAPMGNNDQMNMEDSMAEDSVQAPTPSVPVFGQQPLSSPPGFMFGSTAPSGANPFQFGNQQNPPIQQNQSPFQASGSLECSAGGSFSLGTGGDKSNRKFVKVRKARKK